MSLTMLLGVLRGLHATPKKKKIGMVSEWMCADGVYLALAINPFDSMTSSFSVCVCLRLHCTL